MYTTYITIILGFVFVFVVPLLYYKHLKKKKARKEINNFTKLAKQRNLNLDFAESMPNLLIGLDATSKKLFASEGLNGEKELIADLQELVSCEIHTVRRPHSGEINFIALQLNSPAKADHKIIFYNAGLEVHPDAVRRLEAAEKWNKIVSANIRMK